MHGDSGRACPDPRTFTDRLAAAGDRRQENVGTQASPTSGRLPKRCAGSRPTPPAQSLPRPTPRRAVLIAQEPAKPILEESMLPVPDGHRTAVDATNSRQRLLRPSCCHSFRLSRSRSARPGRAGSAVRFAVVVRIELPHDPRGRAGQEGVGRHVARDHGAGAHDRVVADRHSAQDRRAGGDPYIAPDDDRPRLDGLAAAGGRDAGAARKD